ncbi:glycoside hydrolase, partial [Microthyrium microscopicum]
AGLVAGHGHLRDYVIDGTTYPAFDPARDYDPKYNIKSIEWGFPKAKGAVGPVENVNSPDVACRFTPLQAPGIESVARAGANITFNWLDWFSSHKGPVLTVSFDLCAPSMLHTDFTNVAFFKIDEQSYDPKTISWGTDWLMKNKNSQTVTIPSDIKPGTYVVRHEIISLHNALNDDYIKKQSGAQFYPQCAKVKVTGDGSATPAGQKLPGLYKWDDKGILVNIFYRPNEYTAPGGPVYKPATVSAPK